MFLANDARIFTYDYQIKLCGDKHCLMGRRKFAIIQNIRGGIVFLFLKLDFFNLYIYCIFIIKKNALCNY